jgi:hypothetical protein
MASVMSFSISKGAASEQMAPDQRGLMLCKEHQLLLQQLSSIPPTSKLSSASIGLGLVPRCCRVAQRKGAQFILLNFAVLHLWSKKAIV